MSSAPKETDDWTDSTITIEQVKEYFAAKKASQPCPICKTESWSMQGQTSALSMLAQEKGKPWAPAMHALPVIILVCDNCKFVRLHALVGVLGDIRGQNVNEQS